MQIRYYLIIVGSSSAARQQCSEVLLALKREYGLLIKL